MGDESDAERMALATLVVRGRAWLEARARGADTSRASDAVDVAIVEFKSCERKRRKADKAARKHI